MYDKFAELLQKNNVKTSDVVKATGIRSGVFSDWKAGRYTPKMDKLSLIAEYFDVSVDFFLSGDDDELGAKKKSVTIPVLGVVAAGIPIEAQENIIDIAEISAEMAKRGNFFGLMVRGDSMQPRMYDGDIVIVREQPDAENGEIVVAKINGEDACVKKLLKFSHGISLQSLNPAYPTMTFTEEQIEKLPVSIIGKVVELRAKF